MLPWQVWLSWLEHYPITERSPVQFLVRGHAGVAGSVPCGSACRRWPMGVSLSYQCSSLFSFSLFLLNEDKINLKKKKRKRKANPSAEVCRGCYYLCKNDTHNPGWCGLKGRVLACKPKGHRFDSQSGRTQAWVPGRVRGRCGHACERLLIAVSLAHWCFSASLSPLSLKSKCK